MGLLDSLQFDPQLYGGQQGGLLDMLRTIQAQQQYQPSAGFPDGQTPGRTIDSSMFDPQTYAPNQAQPISIGSYQMPRIGDASQFASNAVLPQNSTPTVGQVPPPAVQPPPVAQPALPTFLGGQPSNAGVGDRLSAGLQNFANAGGVLPAIANGLSGLLTGNRTDKLGMQQQNLRAQYEALVPTLGPQKAMLAVMNPEAGKLILDSVFGKDKYTPVKTKNMMGEESVSAFNSNTGTIKPVGGAPPSSDGGMLGDLSKTGAEYLATVPKQQAGILQGMVDGTIQPPSSFALAKPYWQTMLAGAKNLDPNFDANTWATRHKMSTDIAASGNSSMGGILSNGKSAFQHLAELSNSMTDLGNTSHNFPGGSAAAAAQNYLGNKVFAGSDTAAKIKAINDNLGHFGQESTKFYSGTGGGVEERMNALKEMNPLYTSSAEMAAYLTKEKGLMLDRLRQKEAQIRDTMGEMFLQKHPVFTPQLQDTISHIDANIKKLTGDAPTQAAGTVQEGATATNPSTGAKIVFKGGQWVPAQ